ncbi:Protein FAR1-RELATED SEQUENCE [Abeliophyllum distichum]|uniref:Protein FAR1-RELATED SEQUENCE n=1 Tax=Abeliophyllum distichum TaxID=126358 RepID=A0ABD1SGJ2_9LAMI
MERLPLPFREGGSGASSSKKPTILDLNLLASEEDPVREQIHQDSGMEAESADNIFVPQVSISRISKIGQEFESHEEAYNFYNQYAREAGFSAHIANSKKNKESNEIYWKLFTCSKEGKTDETYQIKHKEAVVRTGVRNRGQTQTGCNARLSVVK